MKVIVSSKSLKEIIAKIDSIPVGRDVTQQAGLAHIVADIEGLHIQRIAPSCGIVVDLEEGVEIEDDGSCFVGFESLSQAIKGPGEKLKIETDGKFLRVSSGSWKASLKVIESEEITEGVNPENLTKPMALGKIEQPAQEVIRLFETVNSAADIKGEKAKGIYQCVALIPFPNGTIVAGMDGRRFHFRAVAWGVKEPVLIPLSSESAIRRIVGKEDGRLTMEIGTGTIRISGPGYKAYLPLLEGSWPDINQVFGISKFRSEFTCNREELKEALSAAQPFSPISLVTIRAEGRSLKISASGGKDDNEFDATIKCKHDGIMVVGCNAGYLLSALGTSGSEEVTIKRAGEPIDMLLCKEPGLVWAIATMRTEGSN